MDLDDIRTIMHGIYAIAYRDNTLNVTFKSEQLVPRLKSLISILRLKI